MSNMRCPSFNWLLIPLCAVHQLTHQGQHWIGMELDILCCLYFTVSVCGKWNEQHAMSVVQLAANPTVCRSSTDPPGATLDWDGVGYLVLFVFHSVGVW